MASRRESAFSSRSSTNDPGRGDPGRGDADRAGDPGRTSIGRVGRPHGVHGAFHVSGPTDRVELLDAGRSVSVAGAEREIIWRRGTDRRPLLKLDGIDDRDAAAVLTGEPITIPRQEAGPMEEGEHLVADLVGCEVTDGDARVGRVCDVLLLPSVDCLEVERDAGTLLVPLVRDAVRSVDTAARRIDVDLGFVEGR